MAKFEFIKNEIPGLVVIKPTVFGDDRGFFMETYQKDEFARAGIDKEFVQDNHSKSSKGVLRGLHFQTENTQGKLVRVIRGSVYDVAVDCRPNSKTFGKWYGVTLTEENKMQFIFLRALLTASWFYPTRRNLFTNAQMFTTPMQRAVFHTMTRL